MASQRVFEDVVEDAAEVAVEVEVEAYRRDRVIVDLEPPIGPLHRQRRGDIDDFMGNMRERTGCYKRRIVEKENRGEIGFVEGGKPIGRYTGSKLLRTPLVKCNCALQSTKPTEKHPLSLRASLVFLVAGVSRRKWRV